MISHLQVDSPHLHCLITAFHDRVWIQGPHRELIRTRLQTLSLNVGVINGESNRIVLEKCEIWSWEAVHSRRNPYPSKKRARASSRSNEVRQSRIQIAFHRMWNAGFCSNQSYSSISVRLQGRPWNSWDRHTYVWYDWSYRHVTRDEITRMPPVAIGAARTDERVHVNDGFLRISDIMKVATIGRISGPTSMRSSSTLHRSFFSFRSPCTILNNILAKYKRCGNVWLLKVNCLSFVQCFNPIFQETGGPALSIPPTIA